MNMSATQRPIVLVTEELAEPALRWLAERCDVRQCMQTDPGFDALLREAEALIVRTYTRVDDALLKRASRVRIVGRAGVGLDNIDLDACRSRGVQVVHTPDANTQAVVEYVVCLICDAIRPRLALDAPVDHDTWVRLRRETVGVRGMSDATLGILGMGRIGSRVAEVAGALGVRVLFNDLLDIPVDNRCGAAPVDVDTLFRASDVVTIHIDGRPANREFVDADLINLMQDDVVFINTSRGFAVDNMALAAFLKAHPRAQALLDVHEPEPIEAGYPLLGLSNAKLYPHLAARTPGALENMSWVVRDVYAGLMGEEPKHRAV
jgi:phosphoglycerate dehydrogenase-like enzyme